MNSVVGLSVEESRKSLIAEFLSCGGMKLFQEELAQLMDGSNSTVQDMLSSKVDDKKLAELNFKLGDIEGQKKVQYILDSFKEEVEENSANSQAKVAVRSKGR